MPRAWKRGVLVVLAGYIDGSNLHDDVDVIAVAGCAASCDSWIAWEDKWKELLIFSDLERWHHTDFLFKVKKDTGRPTRNWKEPEWLIARRMLCEAFEIIKPFCFGTTVVKKDYEELRKRHSSLPDDPYYFLLDRGLHRLIQGLFEHPHDDGMLIYCDQDKKESLVLQLAQWHENYLRNADLFRQEDKERKIVTSYGSNRVYLPLQAADVIAREIMGYARRSANNHFLIQGQLGSFILDRLYRSGPMMVVCLQKEMLEMELDGRAWVPGHPHGYRFVPPVPDA
jgi:hypothetical protein